MHDDPGGALALALAATANYPVGETIVPEPEERRASLAATLASADTSHPLGPPSDRPLPNLSVDLEHMGESLGSDLEVSGLIGEGGMGRVLMARQHSLGRQVAIKTTKVDAPRRVRDALLLEGRVTGQLEHPSIVPVHSIGVDAKGHPALVMKRIDGTTWDRLIADPDHPGWEGWDGDGDDRLLGHLQVLQQVCQALRFAHRHHVIHRDIKPENVLIGRFGDAYLADWGIAAAAGEQQQGLCGTPNYIAPEMVQRGQIDERTDVYLLGAVLHCVLTGRPRHDYPDASSAIKAAAVSAPHEFGPHVPSQLAKLANRACDPDPENRPASVAAFRQALQDFVRHQDAAELARQAQAEWLRARQLLELDKPTPDNKRELERHLAAARFGSEQALKLWDDNELANATLSELEEVLKAQRKRAEELERLALEVDPNVAATARALALSAFAGVGILVGGWTFASSAMHIDRARLIGIPSLLLVAIGVALYTLRRQLLSTRFNRQAAGVLTLAMSLILAHRLAVIGQSETLDLPNIFLTDHLIIVTTFLMGGILLLPWLFIVGFFAAGFALAAAYLPEYSVPLFGLGTVVEMMLTAGLAWRFRHTPQKRVGGS